MPDTMTNLAERLAKMEDKFNDLTKILVTIHEIHILTSNIDSKIDHHLNIKITKDEKPKTKVNKKETKKNTEQDTLAEHEEKADDEKPKSKTTKSKTTKSATKADNNADDETESISKKESKPKSKSSKKIVKNNSDDDGELDEEQEEELTPEVKLSKTVKTKAAKPAAKTKADKPASKAKPSKAKAENDNKVEKKQANIKNDDDEDDNEEEKKEPVKKTASKSSKKIYLTNNEEILNSILNEHQKNELFEENKDLINKCKGEKLKLLLKADIMYASFSPNQKAQFLNLQKDDIAEELNSEHDENSD